MQQFSITILLSDGNNCILPYESSKSRKEIIDTYDYYISNRMTGHAYHNFDLMGAREWKPLRPDYQNTLMYVSKDKIVAITIAFTPTHKD